MGRNLVCLGTYFDMLATSGINSKSRSEEAVPDRTLIETAAPRMWASTQVDDVPPKPPKD